MGAAILDPLSEGSSLPVLVARASTWRGWSGSLLLVFSLLDQVLPYWGVVETEISVALQLDVMSPESILPWTSQFLLRLRETGADAVSKSIPARLYLAKDGGLGAERRLRMAALMIYNRRAQHLGRCPCAPHQAARKELRVHCAFSMSRPTIRKGQCVERALA